VLFEGALRHHAARDVSASIALTRRALELDPEYIEALEHLATLLITRRRRYAEGLSLIDRAVAARPEDAGIWYAAGWCYEFAAHEIKRRAPDAALEPKALYQRSAEAFRHCLALHPEGKLVGDAEDLLDHVENELRSM
jgi:tetratricopeptide (TPR) repeat protein